MSIVRRIEAGDPYFEAISSSWSDAIPWLSWFEEQGILITPMSTGVNDAIQRARDEGLFGGRRRFHYAYRFHLANYRQRPEVVERTIRALRPHIGSRLPLPDGSFALSTYGDGDGAIVGKHKVLVFATTVDAGTAPAADPAARQVCNCHRITEGAVCDAVAAGGHVWVDASENREKGEVSICVSDDGRGIPRDKLQSIFRPFVQVDASHSRLGEGTGLGLAISRDLARGMGGELEVTSELGDGSSFRLTLPLAAPAPDAELRRRPEHLLRGAGPCPPGHRRG